jgi:peptidoglycan/xylan/chitin deacetylase (PgdA/CDA1 family)
MRVPGLKTARLTARRLLDRARSGAVVLGYHRVSEDSWDPFGVGVLVGNFAEQMEVLAQVARPMALEELLDVRHESSRRARAVAVTFDDAYSECLDVVAPIIERYGIPITVFSIAGLLGEEPWWERLARLLEPSRPGGSIKLETDRGVQVFCSKSSDRGHRASIAREVHRALESQDSVRRADLLADLEGRWGSEGPAAHRILTPQELRELACREGVTVGAHGDTHTKLSELGSTGQAREIEGSKQALEKIVGRPVTGFSYPHGAVNPGARERLVRAGFAYACSSRPGCVLPESDLFDLPRIWAPDVDGRRFRRWFRGWVG